MKNSVFKTILSVCIILMFSNYSSAQESPAEVLKSLTPINYSFLGGLEWGNVNTLQITGENILVLNAEDQYRNKEKIIFGIKNLKSVKEYSSFDDDQVIELIFGSKDAVIIKGDNGSSSKGQLFLIYSYNDHQKALEAYKKTAKNK